MARYTTRTEAINYEIISPIQAGESNTAEYDIEAIADAVLLGYEDGYALDEDADFWTVVQDNAL